MNSADGGGVVGSREFWQKFCRERAVRLLLVSADNGGPIDRSCSWFDLLWVKGLKHGCRMDFSERRGLVCWRLSSKGLRCWLCWIIWRQVQIAFNQWFRMLTGKAQAGVSRVAFDILLLVQWSEQRWILPAVAGGNSVSSFLPYLLILLWCQALRLRRDKGLQSLGHFFLSHADERLM